jgi:hypothetical protein
VGATALAGRLWVCRNGRAVASSAPEAPLAMHALGGPLVAVCGLVGGAGASTLAYLVARQAARHSSVPVLLTELYDRGALANVAGGGGDHGLAGLSIAIDNQQPIAAPFTELAGGPRLVAAAQPSLEPAQVAPAEALERVLADARAAHGLVVVDAGQGPDPGTTVLLQAATHVLFVVSAAAPALARVERLGAAGLFARSGGTRTSLVCVATRPGRCATVKQARQLAERHTDRLLLVPHVPALAAGQPDRAERQLQPTYSALASLLRGLP